MNTEDEGSYSEYLGDDIWVLVRAGEELTEEEKAALKSFLLAQRAARQE